MNKNAVSPGNASLHVRKLTYAALFLAIALVLPFITGQIPEIGQALSPMHIPVLLCGFVCGWPWGLAVGVVAPLLRSALFGMPPFFPGAVAMAVELPVYGLVAGWLRRALPKKVWALYVALVVAMVAGRLAWGAARLVIAGITGAEFTWPIFLAGAVLNAVPGIILHLALIPVLVMVMEKAGLSLNK